MSFAVLGKTSFSMAKGEQSARWFIFQVVSTILWVAEISP